MQNRHSSLGNEAFGDQAASLITIRYRSHQDALEFMQSTLRGPNGIGLLRGSEGAGKTVLIIRGLHKKPSYDQAGYGWNMAVNRRIQLTQFRRRFAS